MSNARILADLMGTSTTVPSSKLSLAAGDLPSGTVLQVVEGRSNASSFTPTALDTYQDIGLSVSITPSSSSSKIFVTFTSGLVANNTAHFTTRLLRDSTVILYTSQYFSGANWQGANAASVILDAPSTTSAVTYKVQGEQDSGSIGHAIWDYNGNVSCIIAMEIAD